VGREGRIVGNGLFFGEFGGAFEIAVKSLQQVNYAWIKRIPPTALTNVFLEASGAEDVMDLMERVSNNIYNLNPSLAVEIFRVARDGDEAAQEVIRWAGEELGWLAVSVIRQLGLEDEAVEVVQSGSVFEGGSLICEPMKEIILQYAPRVKMIRLDAPPVAGALLLAMEITGADGYAIRETLIGNVKEKA
jgi:N-acetylglucosamine kinase-like BadF-type ATPase